VNLIIAIEPTDVRIGSIVKANPFIPLSSRFKRDYKNEHLTYRGAHRFEGERKVNGFYSEGFWIELEGNRGELFARNMLLVKGVDYT
jgi:hypothetical protein